MGHFIATVTLTVSLTQKKKKKIMIFNNNKKKYLLVDVNPMLAKRTLFTTCIITVRKSSGFIFSGILSLNFNIQSKANQTGLVSCQVIVPCHIFI